MIPLEMHHEISRRSLLKIGGLVVVTPIAAGAIAGCAAGAAVPESLPLLDWVVTTAGTAFASEVGTLGADAAPAFVKNAVSYLNAHVRHHSTPKLTWVRSRVPENRLKSAVHALHLDSDGHTIASTVHVTGAHEPLLIPSVYQLGLNCLTLSRAGFRGQFFTQKPKRRLTGAQMNGLRTQHSLAAFPSGGSNWRVDKAGKWSGITVHDQHIDVEWTPSKNASEDCLLVVRKGQKPQGSSPRWDTQVSFAVPYRYVFKK